MKSTIFILFALLGLCVGSRYPMTYTYKYNSTVRIGVPDSSDSHTQFGFRSNVKITLLSESEANFVIQDPKFYDYLGKLGNRGSDVPSSIQWKTLMNSGGISNPFKMVISENQEVIQIGENEALFIKNLKKAIATVFRVPHFLSHAPRRNVNIRENRISSSDEQVQRSFRKWEHLVQGKCYSTYTMTNASVYSPLFEGLPLKSSSGGARDSAGRGLVNRAVPHVEGNWYEMVKSVDHDNCTELVVSVKANHGNFSRAGTGYLKGFQSRSSTSQYLLQGTPTSRVNSLVVQKAHVEGYVTINPIMADISTKMVFVTNQTVVLIDATPSSTVQAPTNLKKESWLYQITSPNKPGPNSPSWIKFLGKSPYSPHVPEIDWTGLNPSQLDQIMKQSIERMIQEVNTQFPEPYSSAFGGSVIYLMDSLASRVRALSVEDLRPIFSRYVSGNPNNVPQEQRIKRAAVIDSFSVAGSPSSIKVLLENMKQNKLSDFEVSKVWVTVADNVGSAVNINSMIRFVKELPQNTQRNVKSSVYLSLSNIIRKLCLTPNPYMTYTWPNQTYGEEQCPMRQIQEYATYLVQKLESTSDDLSKPLMIQASAFLGHPVTVSKLISVAEKRVAGYDDVLLRILSIVGLSKEYVGRGEREQAMLSLMYIAESRTESERVRQAAFATLNSFPHDAEYWQRLALLSRKETSSYMINFIKSILLGQSMSKNMLYRERTAMARHGVEQTLNSYATYDSFMQKSSGYADDDVQLFDVVWSPENNYTDSRSLFRKPFFNMFKEVLGGIELDVKEYYNLGNCRILNLLTLLADKTTRSRMQQRNGRVEEQFESFTSGHRSGVAGSSDLYDKMCVILHKSVGHLEDFSVLRPLETEIPEVGNLEKMLKKITDNPTYDTLSYTSPIDIAVMMPSESGFPIITQITEQYLKTTNRSLTESGEQVKSPSDLLQAESLKVSGSLDYCSSRRVSTTVKSLIPMAQLTLQSTFNHDFEQLLPRGHYMVHLDRSNAAYNKMEIEATPAHESKVTMWGYSKQVLIALRPIYSPVDILNEPKIVKIDRAEHSNTIKLPVELTGVAAQIKIEGQTAESVKAVNLMSLVAMAKNPLSFIAKKKISKISVEYDPQASETKTIKATLMHAKMAPRGEVSPSSQPQTLESLSAEDTIQQRMEKLRSTQAPVSQIWSMKLKLQGSQGAKKYEGVALKFHSAQPESKFFQMNFMHGRLPSSPAQQVCVSGKINTAEANRRDSVEERSVLDAKVFIGEKCQASNIVVEAEGSMKLRSNAKRQGSEILQVIPAALEQIKLKLHKKKETPRLVELLEIISEKVMNKLSRKVTCERRRQQPHITLSRTPVSGMTTVSWPIEGRQCVAKDVYIPMNLTPYVKAGFKKVLSSNSKAPLNAQCVIKPRSVKTFLGEVYEKQPVKCLTIGAAFMKQPSKKFVVMVKEEEQSQKQQVKIVYPADSLVVEVKENEVLVNGEKVNQAQKEIRASHGELMLKIEQSAESKKVVVPGKFSVELKQNAEELKIKVSDAYRSKMVGLCGNFGERRVTELRDSKGCYYQPRQGKIYAAAWIASSEANSCRHYNSYSNLLQEVERMRHHCAKDLESLVNHVHH